MGSRLRTYARLLLPRTGTVAPNAAIALDGHNVGVDEMTLAARVGDAELEIVVEQAPWLSYDRFESARSVFLVRPRTGDWPPGATVMVKTLQPPELEVAIGTLRDVAAPAFTSLGAPASRSLAHPHGTTDVIAIDHGAFDDPASAIVLVTLELGTTTRTGAVLEGRAGTLTLQPRADLGHVHAITLADSAGNSHRIVAPSGPPSEVRFTSLAGALECVVGAPGTFVATTDRGSANGFSRGHFLTTQPYDGDIEIAVSATRLSDEHAMPIEIAFRGGFFGVTGTSLFYLYEDDAHWTGWKPTRARSDPHHGRCV